MLKQLSKEYLSLFAFSFLLLILVYILVFCTNIDNRFICTILCLILSVIMYKIAMYKRNVYLTKRQFYTDNLDKKIETIEIIDIKKIKISRNNIVYDIIFNINNMSFTETIVNKAIKFKNIEPSYLHPVWKDGVLTDIEVTLNKKYKSGIV